MRRRRDSGGAVIDINLLPRAQRPPDVPRIAVAGAFAVVIAIAVLIPLSYRASAARDDAAAVQRRANAAEQALGARRVDLTAHRALTMQLQDLQGQLDQLRGERQQLQGGQHPLADDLVALLAQTLPPPGASITKVTGTARGFRVEGTAAGPLDAIALADRLARDARFASAGLISFTPAGAGLGNFDIEVGR